MEPIFDRQGKTVGWLNDNVIDIRGQSKNRISRQNQFLL